MVVVFLEIQEFGPNTDLWDVVRGKPREWKEWSQETAVGSGPLNQQKN